MKKLYQFDEGEQKLLVGAGIDIYAPGCPGLHASLANTPGPSPAEPSLHIYLQGRHHIGRAYKAKELRAPPACLKNLLVDYCVL